MTPTLQTLMPVAAGIAVVLVTILVFRLHAFFALLLAAATTAALTPYEIRLETEIRKVAVPSPAAHEGYPFPYGTPFTAWTEQDGRLAMLGESPGMWVNPDERWRVGWSPEYAYLTLPNGNGWTGPLPSSLLVTSEQEAAARRAASQSVPARITMAFGETFGSIGLLIAFAAVIGACLLDSGGADRIVRSALSLVGEKGAPVAFTGCGFLLGVPVFFDTVFLLMIPLGKAMRLRTGRNYILYVLTIVCGATMAHSLVPPTPGPLLVAEALNVEVGMMILVGTVVGLVTAAYGILHALVINRWMDIPLRDTPEMPLKDLEERAARPDHELPPLWLSLLPIVVPVFLIAQETALKLFLKSPPGAFAEIAQQTPGWLITGAATLGEKNTAVGIGVALGLFLLVWQTRQSLSQVRDRVGRALAGGGLIILITAAGGAFGEMLEQTGVASLIKQMPSLSPAGLLGVAFLVTTAIRTAQGSATVAMITAVGLFSGIALPFNAVWLALAIGCGSKPISWMTDSGFWVICKMSGMTETETLKTLTPMTSLMGVVGLITVIAGATLFPMGN